MKKKCKNLQQLASSISCYSSTRQLYEVELEKFSRLNYFVLLSLSFEFSMGEHNNDDADFHWILLLHKPSNITSASFALRPII